MQGFVSQDAIRPGGQMRLAVRYDLPTDYHIQVNELLFAEPVEGEPFRLGPQQLPATTLWEGEPVLMGKVVVIYDLELLDRCPSGRAPSGSAPAIRPAPSGRSMPATRPRMRRSSFPIKVVGPGTDINLTPSRRSSADCRRPSRQMRRRSNRPRCRRRRRPGRSGWRSRDMTPDLAPAPVEAPKASFQEGLAQKLRNALARGSWIAFLIVFIAGFLTSLHALRLSDDPDHDRFHHRREPRPALGVRPLALLRPRDRDRLLDARARGGAAAAAIFGQRSAEHAGTARHRGGLPCDGRVDARRVQPDPSFRTSRRSCSRGGAAGWIGAIMMGGITGLVASPCVGPVLVVLLDLGRAGWTTVLWLLPALRLRRRPRRAVHDPRAASSAR